MTRLADLGLFKKSDARLTHENFIKKYSDHIGFLYVVPVSSNSCSPACTHRLRLYGTRRTDRQYSHSVCRHQCDISEAKRKTKLIVLKSKAFGEHTRVKLVSEEEFEALIKKDYSTDSTFLMNELL